MFKKKFVPIFNENIEISSSGGSLSIDGGLPLIKDFMCKSKFFKLFNQTVRIEDARPRVIHPTKDIVEQLILLKALGYDTDDSADSLLRNTLFTSTLGVPSLASQPTISRMWHRLTPKVVEQCFEVNQRYIDQYYENLEDFNQPVLIDLDSTHFDTYGNQENKAFNRHYQTFGYHPLVAFDGLTGLFLGAQLRPGNLYTSNGVVAFLEPILQHFIDDLHLQNILIRADSGFAVPELYDLCEKYSVRYIIRMKSNKRLVRSSEELAAQKPNCGIKGTEYRYKTITYQANSWTKERKVVIQNERPFGELLFTPMFIVTNVQEMTAETVTKVYKGRGQMENYIKEAKRGFFLDKTDSTLFSTNEARMVVAMLSYNIVQMMKLMVFPKKMTKWSIGTIRHKLFKVAVRVVSHAKKIYFKLDETFVYLQDYFSCCHKLQQFKL